MIKEIAFLFGWLFANGCLVFYNPWLAAGVFMVVILMYKVIK